jgi:sterol desaturase/sphingolipid hydroxylase (fatty acid hydroxylase superfamily)
MVFRLLLVMAVFVPLERLAPHRRDQQILRSGWATDAASYVGNGLLYLGIFYVWVQLVPDALGWARPLVLPISLKDQPGVVQAIAVLAVGSFTYYWGHRLLHWYAPLWRFHAVHHSARHLDWLATYRGHVFETCYFTALSGTAMFILNVSAPAMFLFAVYSFFEGQIEHSNVRVPLGPLRWVVPSPWFHHWHHATDADARDKNFSPYPIWDVLFGTAFMPSGRLPSGFGLRESMPETYLGQVAYPFGLAERVGRAERWLTERWPRPRLA